MKFKYSGKGGYREGAGRPKEPGAGVPHRPRGRLDARYPVHVTVRVRDEVAKLRSKACFRAIAAAISAAKERFGFRLAHVSVQANHLHLIAEVEDEQALARDAGTGCARGQGSESRARAAWESVLRTGTTPTCCGRRAKW